MTWSYYLHNIDIAAINLVVFITIWVVQDDVNPLYIVPAAFYSALYPFAKLTLEILIDGKPSNKHWGDRNSLAIGGYVLYSLLLLLLTLPLCIIFMISIIKRKRKRKRKTKR